MVTFYGNSNRHRGVDRVSAEIKIKWLFDGRYGLLLMHYFQWCVYIHCVYGFAEISYYWDIIIWRIWRVIHHAKITNARATEALVAPVSCC